MKRIIIFSLLSVCVLVLVACQSSTSEKKESPYLGKWYVIGKDNKATEMKITEKTITIDSTAYNYTETGQGALTDGRPFYTVQYGDNKEYTILFLEEDKTRQLPS